MAEEMSSLDADPILARLREGDKKAYRDVYFRYHGLLCRLSHQLLHQWEPAEEIVDDVFLELWKRRETLMVGSLRNYLMRSVRNRCINELRSGHRRYLSAFSDISDAEGAAFLETLFPSDDNPIDRLLGEEMTDRLRAAIERLPAESRRVFLLSRQDDLSYQQIAEKLGISVNTVKYHIKQALRMLGQVLGKHLALLLLII